MRALVTGGAGYIGSHTCKLLARQGHEPVVYDNLSRGHRWAVKWGPLEKGDISDEARVRAALDRYRPEAVIHFAAFSSVGESVSDPLLYYLNNVAASAALIKAIVDFGPIPFIFSSTAAVYGIPKTIPISEDEPPAPINPYGFSKLAIERMLADAERAYGLKSVSLRYFNAAGADPDGEIGEAHDPETHLVPLVLAAARDGSAVNVFGDDYDTPDGTCIRDYIHVMDLADAHVRALDYLTAGGASTVCNLANARGHSVAEVLTAAERVTGRAVQRRIAGRREGDPPVLIGKVDRAVRLLGWRRARSELDVQIGDAWRWMQRGQR